MKTAGSEAGFYGWTNVALLFVVVMLASLSAALLSPPVRAEPRLRATWQ